jgi:protein-tyrosine phosphatase
VKVLFVCLGNICRSPTAEGVVRVLAKREAPELALEVDSAGTAGYHVGEPPDARTRAAARRRGYDLEQLRARVVEPQDFERFDLLLAMDEENLRVLRRRAPPQAQTRLRLFLEFAPEQDMREVPDPYYGGANGFEEVLDLVEVAARGLLRHLRQHTRAA